VELDPNSGQARYDLASTLLQAALRQAQSAASSSTLSLPNGSSGSQLDEAVEQFRATLRLMPDSVEAHNNLGIALASQGKLDEAIDHFQQALTRDPEFADARRNLTAARRQRER
jgi:tetratricopeptide (TPR) repeat protein